jgi:endonuclease/exonuclease/phosphatase family metal-dependent hydrolase
LALLVRTWNLFHGRTKPASGRAYLERMVRLVSADGPDLVALQEVPVWALAQLEAWSGMPATGAVARPGRFGQAGRRLTARAPDVLRSALNGQANALLVARRLRLRQATTEEIRGRGAVERRVCQLARVAEGKRELLVANVHTTAHFRNLAREELARVAELVAGEEPTVVCGDFNVPGEGLHGFSEPIAGLDQIVVRGLRFERPPARWDPARRALDGVLLSDHAPVEAVIA